MSWPLWLLMAWLAGHIILPPALYIGYGFVMAAKRAKDAGLSLPHVFKTDAILAIPCVLLDGIYNALWLPFVCLDFRPHYAFRMVTFKGVTFPFFELTTERLSRYNEDATQWAYLQWIARVVAPFLDAKDPKGWHVRKQGGINE